MLSRTARHRALRESLEDIFPRDVIPERYAELEERDPSLLNLPIPLPSIPVLAPVLTLVVGGKKVTTTAAIATTHATTAPASTPTTTSLGTTTTASSGSGSDPGSGSPNGSGGSGGSQGGSQGGSGGSGGSGPGPGSGSSDTGASAGSPGSITSADSQAGSSSNSNVEASHPTGAGGGVLAAGSNPTGVTKDLPNAHPTGSTTVVVTGGKTLTVIGSVTYSTGVPIITGGSAGTSPVPSGTSADSGIKKGGLPTFAAALIGVVVGLLLLLLLILCVRRRAMAKRAARRTWWSGVQATKAEPWSGRDSGDATAGANSSARSVRSSFGTTFDHSEFSVAFDDNVPELPPMAEIRGGPGLVPKGDSSMSGNGQPLSPISPVSATSPVFPMPLLVSIENSNIFSDANRRSSAGSNSSASSAQYLSYSRDASQSQQLLTQEVATPMSVRPFSPSESFAFPTPPRADRTSTASQMTTPAGEQYHIPPTSTLPSPVPPHITETFAPIVPPPIRVSENPFADAFAAPSTPARASAEFDAVETIWRPFEETLQDEMTVLAGDKVKVLAVYDDGWAMIERVGLGKGKGKADNGKPSVGLIPIDCMRKSEESVSAFLAAKRVSSVDATGYEGMAI